MLVFLLEPIQILLFLLQVFEHDRPIILVNHNLSPFLDLVDLFLLFGSRILQLLNSSQHLVFLFLKGCFLTDEHIDFLNQLLSGALEVFSCFLLRLYLLVYIAS